MLMVVSCTQEVAPKNELVEVKLSTVFGRDIEITGGTKTDNLTYKYTMTPNWNGWTTSSDEAGIGSENISGIVTEKTVVEKDMSLGWVTPGLWNVSVYAYDNTNTNTEVFEGSTEAYFSNQKARVTVYLKPVKQSNNSLTFAIRMQDLNTNGGSYKLKYTVVGTPSIPEEIQLNETSISGELVRIADESSDNVSMYKLASYDANKTRLNSLASDYYRVTVSIYDGTTLLGGITKGVLLSNGDAGEVTGNIEPSDYINAQFDVKLLHVDTSLTSSGVTYYSDKNYTNVITEPTENTEATEILAQSAKATITLTDNTDFDKFDGQSVKNDYSVVNKWYVDGVEKGSGDSFELKYTTPGYKNVSCQTIYYKEIGDVVYYWANTASIQVPFEGNKFAKD